MEKHASGPQEEGNSGRDLSSGFLNVQHIAEYLKVRVSTVYTLGKEKRIPHYRIGRQIRFKKSEIDEWMAGQKEPVVDVKVEAKKIVRSLHKKPDLAIDRIVKKAIEGTTKKEYTVSQEKPGRIEGLETEVKHGII